MNIHISEEEAAKHIGISLRTLQAMRRQSKGPNSMKIGRSYVYATQDLNDWLERQANAAVNRRFASSNDLFREFFAEKVERTSECASEFVSQGTLRLIVLDDGQVWIGFEGGDGTMLSFECFGFNKDSGFLWSTGDVILRRLGGENDHVR
jgi:predicted DNA-binding transcriptional regulator AlpA